jgi:glycosyltransferase involved in cell wall biosynthesis
VVGAGARPDNVTVVLNGIDPSAFKRDPSRVAEARARYGARLGEIVLGAVGRLEPQKRFDILIAAFARLSGELPNLKLLIAGDGSLKGPLLQQIAGAGISERCQLLGHVDDVRLFHHALDLFVQSSDYEGTPNSVLEAMALETPIVATNAGGTAEIARHGQEGLIVRPGDEDELRVALGEALKNGDGTARRAVAARRRVETDLSFDTRMRKIERIYDDLATRFPRRHPGDGSSLSNACATP